MADPADDEPLLPSLLDRLLDEQNAGGERRRGHRLSDLKRAMARDLEQFLNTRRRCRSLPGDLRELAPSVLDYGIPDFTGANLASMERRDSFRAAIEAAVRRYEPRFKAVQVVMLDNANPLDRSIRFRIEALMHAEPAPEPLILDSRVDPVTRAYHVRETSGG